MMIEVNSIAEMENHLTNLAWDTINVDFPKIKQKYLVRNYIYNGLAVGFFIKTRMDSGPDVHNLDRIGVSWHKEGE